VCQGFVPVALDVIASDCQLVVRTKVEHITLLIAQSTIVTVKNLVDIAKPDYWTFFSSNEANLLSFAPSFRRGSFSV
jgi:hypothetical protein